MNRAIISGEVSSYGPKISWTDSGKPQTAFTLIIEKSGFKTFIPCLCVGSRAEEVAETVNAGDILMIEGSLSWRAGRTKEAGKLIVACFEVERLAMSPQDERTETGEGDSTSAGEIVEPEPIERATATKARRPRQPKYTGVVSALRGVS